MPNVFKETVLVSSSVPRSQYRNSGGKLEIDLCIIFLTSNWHKKRITELKKHGKGQDETAKVQV